MGLLRNIVAWAVGNYPAGANPWNGQPMRVQPANAYVTPETTRPAETDNWIYGSIIDVANALNGTVAGMFAANWPNWTPTEDSQLNADYIRVGGSGYLPITGQTSWLAIGGAANLPTSGTNTMTVVQSTDGGRTFQNLNFPSTGFTAHSGNGHPYDIAGDTTGGALVLFDEFTTVPAVHLAALYSGTWHSATANYAGTFPASLGWDATNSLYFFGDVFGLYTVPASSTTVTFHAPSGTPSGAASVLTSLIVQKGDGTMIVVPATQTGTVWAHSAAYSSPTSTTPTYGTFPVASTDVITAGDYSPGDSSYMVAQYDGSSVTHFLRSADGVTWTATTGSILGQVVGLAVIANRVWVALRSDYLLFYSTDLGETWTPCVDKLAGNVNQFHGFKSNATKNQIAAFGSFSYKNQSTPTESRMMITSLISG